MTRDGPRGDEANLVRLCAAGDEAAWTTFVDRYGPLLTALARRMLVRRGEEARTEDVDEVVAEVFLALLRRDRLLLRRYDPRWQVSTYLGVICRTAVGRLLGRQRRDTTLRGKASEALQSRGDGEGAWPGLTAEERDRARRALLGALDTLAPRDRLILALRFFEGLDYQALAVALGVSAGSVGPLLSRAKRRLARRLPDLPRLLGEDASED